MISRHRVNANEQPFQSTLSHNSHKHSKIQQYANADTNRSSLFNLRPTHLGRFGHTLHRLISIYSDIYVFSGKHDAYIPNRERKIVKKRLDSRHFLNFRLKQNLM